MKKRNHDLRILWSLTSTWEQSLLWVPSSAMEVPLIGKFLWWPEPGVTLITSFLLLLLTFLGPLNFLNSYVGVTPRGYQPAVVARLYDGLEGYQIFVSWCKNFYQDVNYPAKVWMSWTWIWELTQKGPGWKARGLSDTRVNFSGLLETF